jgi:hypothetical protein
LAFEYSPGADRDAVARHRQPDDHLRVVVPALLAVAALAQGREGEPAPVVLGEVLLVGAEPGRGGVVEHQVDVELEQVDRAPEHVPLDRVALLGQEIERTVELVQPQPLRLGEPDRVQPALPAGELARRLVQPLHGHREQGRGVRGGEALGLHAGRDRRPDPELLPQGSGDVGDAQLLDPLDRELARGRPVIAGGVLTRHAADAAHQALERGAVELILAAEAVHDPGLDVALPGIADVLGQGQVAHHRAVLVPPPRGPKVHAHSIGVSINGDKPQCGLSCAHMFRRWAAPPGPPKSNEFNALALPDGAPTAKICP